jgi:hypothetical protein
MSIDMWENEGGPCIPEKEVAQALDPFIDKLHDDWSKCSFCGARNGKFGKSLENHGQRCRYIGPANEQRMAKCLECKARKKDVEAFVEYVGDAQFIRRKDPNDFSALWVNRLWCKEHSPWVSIAKDKLKYLPPAPPIKPDPIIFIENFGSWVGEWQLGRRGRVAIDAVQRQYKLVSGHR